ncbi:hypothetical protein DER29_4317 [Micromonospora sp. M71_S20]|uniref:WhiB family transcriptional regulator n=1 Tax=Micromonospora sp. M71_S20 TaxID=592872 RepID=UPI000EAC7447|nr:WhiB family transcriptional regulator [Micromonospora sp. M71_S20]RLK13300.1 hypothetical protein DER29_4317 [Micromonospora sp. M71_S20]
MTAALCATRPADWWDLGDDGNRLALAICRVCPVQTACAATADREAGVIRAGIAYLERGQVAPICQCGYPDDKRLDPRRTTVLCRRCHVPNLRAWRQDRRRYWSDYYRRHKAATSATTKETRAA